MIRLELGSVLSGKDVVHRKLGHGTIEEMSDNYLMVRFDTGDKVSRFVYPDAFEKFLKMKDEDAQAVVTKHLTIKHLLDVEKEMLKKEKLQLIDEELKLKHKEDLIKKQKAAMMKMAREKRIKDKKKVMA